MLNKKIVSSINKTKLRNLLIGIIGIYATFCIGGVLHQYILKKPYIDRIDGTQSYFTNASGLIALQKVVIFSFGYLYNCFFLKQKTPTQIPAKNSILCAIIVFVSSITNNYAMILVSYPIIIMFKSCNILSVILVGVCCSRVKNKELKLGGNKIIGAVVVSIGIIMFKIFDPEAKVGDERKVQIIGLILLFVSLLADGLLPDFQAEIKEKFKPQPTVMLVEINKWCCIVSLVYCIVTGQMVDFINYSWRHPLFAVHLLSMASLAFIGHIFIYNMIKEFKQHIVPFVITTRKIISVGISMIYFRHVSSVLQVIGILLVFGATLVQFLGEVMKSDEKREKIPYQHSETFEQEHIEGIIKTEKQLQQRKDSDQQMLQSSSKH